MKKVIEHLRKYWIIYFFEAVAVLVGILLAFSLDNWGSKRESLMIQSKSIEKLRIDFMADIERFNYLDSIYNLWKGKVDFILNDYYRDPKIN